MGTAVIVGENPNGDLEQVNVKMNALAIVSGGYKDLGLVIDATDMAAGATVYSDWFDGVEWVRNITTLMQSDQQMDVVVDRRDMSLTAATPGTLVSGIGATGGVNWSVRTFTPQNGSNSGAVLGHSGRFGLKNSSASVNTYGKLRIQLQGL